MRKGTAVQALVVAIMAALAGATGYAAGSPVLAPHADMLILLAGLGMATATVGFLSDLDLADGTRERSERRQKVGTGSLLTKVVIIGPLLLVAWGAYWLPSSLATDGLLSAGEFLGVASFANLIWDAVEWRQRRSAERRPDR